MSVDSDHERSSAGDRPDSVNEPTDMATIFGSLSPEDRANYASDLLCFGRAFAQQRGDRWHYVPLSEICALC